MSDITFQQRACLLYSKATMQRRRVPDVALPMVSDELKGNHRGQKTKIHQL